MSEYIHRLLHARPQGKRVTEDVSVRLTKFGDYVRSVRLLPIEHPMINKTQSQEARAKQSAAMLRMWRLKHLERLREQSRIDNEIKTCRRDMERLGAAE